MGKRSKRPAAAHRLIDAACWCTVAVLCATCLRWRRVYRELSQRRRARHAAGG